MINLDTLLGGVVGVVLTAIFGYFGVVRKARADESAIALEAWKALLAPLQEELKQAKEEIANLRKEIEQRDEVHKKEITALMNRLRKVDQNTKHVQE